MKPFFGRGSKNNYNKTETLGNRLPFQMKKSYN